MIVFRVPHVQAVCPAGYEIIEIERDPGDAIRFIAPKERINYAKIKIKIQIEHEIMKLVGNFVNLECLDEQRRVIFANRYGLLYPEDLHHLPEIDLMNNHSKWANYPAEWMKMLDLYQHELLDALTSGRYPIRLIEQNCYFAIGENAEGTPRLELHSKNLLGALAAYVAEKLSEGAKFRKCERCGLWFLVADARSQRARFCGPACRMQVHRRK